MNVATSVGVDVVTKRNVDPTVRALGNAYRVFSIVRPAYQGANAIRIAAYADATALIVQEIVVQFSSAKLAEKLMAAEFVNYEIIAKAEELVLSMDFSRDVPEAVHYVDAPHYYLEGDLLLQDFEGHGKGLAVVVGESISKGVHAHDKARELASHEEAMRVRREYNFRRQELWLDRLNSNLGNVFWQPIPEIGLGTRQVRGDRTYRGTFRQNDPEGYGLLEWSNGTSYWGQVLNGKPCGYGGFRYSDGGRYFGFWPRHRIKNIGAYITPSRDRVIVGVGRGIFPASYGRQIGLKDGVESASGFWSGSELSQPLESMEQVNQKIADRMDSAFTAELKAEYQGRARMDRAHQGVTDAAILSHVSPFL